MKDAIVFAHPRARNERHVVGERERSKRSIRHKAVWNKGYGWIASRSVCRHGSTRMNVNCKYYGSLYANCGATVRWLSLLPTWNPRSVLSLQLCTIKYTNTDIALTNIICYINTAVKHLKCATFSIFSSVWAAVLQ